MNNKTKLGISAGMMVAIIFALGMVSYWCLLACAIFVLLTEDHPWLITMTKKAIFITILFVLIHGGFDIFEALVTIFNSLVQTHHVLPKEWEILVRLCEKIFYFSMVVSGLTNHSNGIMMQSSVEYENSQMQVFSQTSVTQGEKVQQDMVQNTTVQLQKTPVHRDRTKDETNQTIQGEKVCTMCHAINKDGSVFCGNCGTKL